MDSVATHGCINKIPNGRENKKGQGKTDTKTRIGSRGKWDSNKRKESVFFFWSHLP